MRVEAPGKLVLVGEYAVLDGAPAIVAAVDRGVACEVSSAAALDWTTPGDDAFVRAALRAVDAPPARYAFSDWNPVPGLGGRKPGLGGSAAATVAAVVAGLRAAGLRPGPEDVLARALPVHRAVQGGGSGVDVAASAFGGVIRFEAGRVTPVPPVEPGVVFSGASASTAPRVRQWLAWSGRDEVARRSAELTDAFPAAPVAVLDEACRLLREATERAGIAYWTPAIDALVRLAREHRGAAKPSGAGGGDVVVGLFEDPADRAAWLAGAASLGLAPIEVRLAPAP